MTNTLTQKRKLPTGRGGDYYNPVKSKTITTGNPQRTIPETKSSNTTEPSPKATARLPASRGGDYDAPTTPKSTAVPNPQRPIRTNFSNATVLDRTLDTVTGSTKQSLGNFGSGVASFVQSSQSNLLQEEEMKYDREKKRYEEMLLDNRDKPGTWNANLLLAKANELDATKRMLDVGKQAATNSALVQSANSLRDASTALNRSGAGDIARAKEGLGTLGRFAVDVGAAGTQLAGDAALAALTGGTAVLPVKAVQAFGSGAEQARAAGADLDQQTTYGLANAALNLGTEKLFNLATPLKKTYGTGLLESPLSEALDSFRETAPIQMGLSALTEGGEEFAEAMAQPLLQRAIYNPDAKFNLSDAAYQGLVGGTVGGLAGGADAISELDFSDGFLIGFLEGEITQNPTILHESLLQAKAHSEHDPISWTLVDAWDHGLHTGEELNEFYRDHLASIGAENTSLYNIDKFLEAKYSNTKEFDLLRGYSNAVKKQHIPTFLGLDEYRATGKRIEDSLVGITTSTDVTIESFTTHFIDRVVGNPTLTYKQKPIRTGVSISDVMDALQNPVEPVELQTMDDGDIRQNFRGKKIAVTISIRDNRLIQTNPRKEYNDKNAKHD